jgi:hypothetical protein
VGFTVFVETVPEIVNVLGKFATFTLRLLFVTNVERELGTRIFRLNVLILRLLKLKKGFVTKVETTFVTFVDIPAPQRVTQSIVEALE